MSMPYFLHKRTFPDKFTRLPESESITPSSDKSCVCFITDSNSNYVAYTRLACREMRRFIRNGTPIFVLTNEPDKVVVPESDRVIGIEDLIEEYSMRGISQGRFPDIIFAKFLLPLVPELAEYDRIVCYDPDAIAYSDTVNDLLDIGFDGKEAMLCHEPVMTVQHNEIRRTLERTGLINAPECAAFAERMKDLSYCSGGLVVWNARLLHTMIEDYKHRVRFVVANQDKCRFGLPEQNWMNSCITIRTIPIYYDQSWEDDCKNFAVIHYAGELKPVLKNLCRLAGYLPKEYKDSKVVR